MNDIVVNDCVMRLRLVSQLSECIRDEELDTAFLIAKELARAADVLQERLNEIKYGTEARARLD